MGILFGAVKGAFTGEEVLESPASVIFDQAENRLHTQKALMEFVIPAL